MAAGAGLRNAASRLVPISGPADPDLVVLLGPLVAASALVLTTAFTLWCAVVLRTVQDQDQAHR